MMKKHNEELRAKPLQGGEVDMEPMPSLDILSQAKVLNQIGTMLTLGQGLCPPRSIVTWDL